MIGTAGICNVLVILLTAVVSVLAFRNPALEERYIFHPEAILAGKEYYRLVTAAFLHADVSHLLLNLISLYLFGNSVELFLGKTDFLLIYFGSVAGGSLLSLYLHRHHDYRAYGASGGVCGVIFAYLLLFPGAKIYQFPMPIAIPAWLYAIGFFAASFWRMKAGRDNIGHDAHLGGAMVGLLIAAGLEPQIVRYNLKIFLIVLVLALLLLVYVWINPMMLPLASFFGGGSRRQTRASKPPDHLEEQRRVDALLEKIARNGLDSLTAEERASLEAVSAKYQRRTDSKKPESGLAI